LTTRQKECLELTLHEGEAGKPLGPEIPSVPEDFTTLRQDEGLSQFSSGAVNGLQQWAQVKNSTVVISAGQSQKPNLNNEGSRTEETTPELPIDGITVL
jgi:hypothetical protein